MFQFTGFASPGYVFTRRYRRSGGLPHSEIHGSKLTRSSPRLIAACHVLHRLLTPRHPPDALLLLERSAATSRTGPAIRLQSCKPARSSLRFRRAATQLAYIRRSHLFTLSKNIAGDPKGSRFTDRKPDPGIPFRRTRPKPSRFLHRTNVKGPSQGQVPPGQARQMVGPGGLEPPTSRLSGVHSNQLSYWPPFMKAYC